MRLALPRAFVFTHGIGKASRKAERPCPPSRDFRTREKVRDFMACIAKRRDRYVIDFYDNQGKRRWKTLPKGTTKAKEILRELEDQLAKGIYLPDKRTPSFAEVAKDWLEYKKPNLRDSTWSVYEGHTRNHFQDLGPLKINRITTAKIEKFITDRQVQGMNILTLRKILVSLAHLFEW